MRHIAIRWLAALGALAAAGALLLAQSGAAGASLSRAAAPARASAPAYVPPKRILTLGMHGAAVRRLQVRLTALKYYPGPIDGQFGLDTLEAVWAFKETQGLTINSAAAARGSRSTWPTRSWCCTRTTRRT
jgi:peptidoglycan hydrolase-like protein with peptidoglycan-binding domain